MKCGGFCTDAIAVLTVAAECSCEYHVQNTCTCSGLIFHKKMPLRNSSVEFQASGHPTAIPRANIYVVPMTLGFHSSNKMG